MMELQVVLDFACTACRQPVSVTLRCEGEGLARTPAPVVCVHVPCPFCGRASELTFEPTGTLRAVQPSPGVRPCLEPSLN